MAAHEQISECASEIRTLVEARDYGEAARRFLSMAGSSSCAARDRAARDFAAHAGLEARAALVKAFARAPCYCCRGGRADCARCGGKATFAANGEYCDECGGSGRVPCDFCGGSGFLVLEVVPAALQSGVIKKRLEWAAARLLELKQRTEYADDSVSPSFRGLARLFDAAQRIDGVLDELEMLPRGPEHDRCGANATRDTRGLQRCRVVSRACRKRLAGAIAELCRNRADREPEGSRHRIVWQRQHEYFESVADDDNETD